MQIQINTDNNINGDQDLKNYYESQLEKLLGRFDSHVTRIEVHLGDENSDKFGVDDKRCLIEVRMSGKQPLAAETQADTIENAFNASVDKVKRMLDSEIKKMRSY